MQLKPLGLNNIRNDMKMIAFWDTEPHSLAEVDRSFRGGYCIHYQGLIIALMKDAVRTSETTAYFDETARRCIQEGYHLHTRRRKKLKSHKKWHNPYNLLR
jgi:hypothetical protein